MNQKPDITWTEEDITILRRFKQKAIDRGEYALAGGLRECEEVVGNIVLRRTKTKFMDRVLKKMEP